MTENNEPKKSLGQHWLFDDMSLDAMVEAGDIHPGYAVLEVGPGLGTLTKKLLDKGAKVTAVELDERLVDDLMSHFKDQAFSLHVESILEFDLGKLPPDYRMVANIPYYLTSHLIRILTESTNPPLIAAILVQKEVAERVHAEPGKMSILAVAAQLFYETSLGIVIPAEMFSPPPKVDSRILILHRRFLPLFAGVDTNTYIRIVKAGFSGRRKTLRNSLSAGLAISKETAVELLRDAGIDDGARAQELSLDDWHKIYLAIKPAVVPSRPKVASQKQAVKPASRYKLRQKKIL